jgi:hypothetical protein
MTYPGADYRASTPLSTFSGGSVVDAVGRRRSVAVSGTLAVTVHGQGGVVDLLVPGAASVDDVAREYAAQCRLTFVPALHTRDGRGLEPGESLAAAGLTSGAVLVAAAQPRPGRAPTSPDPARGRWWRTEVPGWFSLGWCAVAVATAALAGWFGAHTEGREHDVAVLLLAGTAVLGIMPLGAQAPHRAAAAPAFGAAAAFATTWSPEPERLPAIVGV